MLVRERKEEKQRGNGDVVFRYVLLVMLFVIRQWESGVTGQTLTLNSSRLHHTLPLFPEGIPMCGSHDPGH